MTRKFLLAATALATITAMQGRAQAQPVTGLYIGGSGGANFEQRVREKSTSFASGVVASRQTIAMDTGVAGVGSVGYGFGNGVRVELEGDYRDNRISRPTNSTAVSSGGREQKYGPMLNALFDLDVGSPYVFPYIGGGAGYQWVDRRRSTTNRVGIALPLNSVDSFGPGTIQYASGVDSSFAYQAIAGLSFPVPHVVGLALTAEYRYFSLAGTRSFHEQVGGPGGLNFKANFAQDFNHSLMLGVRYAFNVAPPPVPAAAVAAPSPVAEAARTYLVFFDWDRADLTDRARQIIAQAAQATTRVKVTRIEVSGHTDTSGTPRYNQALSVRRAQAVASELVRLGVPAAAITTRGFGDTHLLVSTGPGVREPQNRRVEIVLQ